MEKSTCIYIDRQYVNIRGEDLELHSKINDTIDRTRLRLAFKEEVIRKDGYTRACDYLRVNMKDREKDGEKKRLLLYNRTDTY